MPAELKIELTELEEHKISNFTQHLKNLLHNENGSGSFIFKYKRIKS